jgi:hypothetical protein
MKACPKLCRRQYVVLDLVQSKSGLTSLNGRINYVVKGVALSKVLYMLNLKERNCDSKYSAASILLNCNFALIVLVVCFKIFWVV